MNEIKHFMLPDHTNTLYKEEARSSIALTKEVADKINELVDAYNTFSKTDLEWKHEQEGRIRGGILYMKDNLINTLNDLMNILEGRGFFDDTVRKYTKDLEAQLNNLLTAETVDGEVIDTRYGADGNTYATAGESIRTQINGLLYLIDNKNLLDGVLRNRGYYTLKSNGEEYLEGEDKLPLTGRDEIYTDILEVEPNTVYSLSYVGDQNFISDDTWLSVHLYDNSLKYVKRVYDTHSGPFMKMIFNTEQYKYIRVNARCYTAGHIKLEKGIFSTLKSDDVELKEVTNLIDKYPLNHKGFYSWSNENNYAHFYLESVNAERSTDFIPCAGKKKLTIYYNYGLNGWLGVNFITKEGYMVKVGTNTGVLNNDLNSITDEKGNTVLRYVFNTTGKYEVDIPDYVYAVGFSLRTVNLGHFAVFFDDMEGYERKYYELLHKTKEVISMGNGDIPVTEPYEIKDIAHRGLSSVAPENTLPAYIKAYEKGFKYVECDVLFSSDNVPVLIHDNTIDRISNGSGYVAEKTYSVLRSYDFGSWFSSTYAGTKIPSFEEFISLCRKLKLHPYIEVKGDTTITHEQLDILIGIVKKYGMIKNVTWICFEYTNLEYIVSQVNTARVGYTVGTLTNTVVEMTKELKTGYNEVFVDTNAYDDTSIQYAIDNGIPVERYTIDDESTILSQSPYISGVTSNSLLASEILKESVI